MVRKHRTARGSGQSVLLVDDDEAYLAATRRMLEAEGHLVVTASCGSAALAIHRDDPVDAIVLDYSMPGMTGECPVRISEQWRRS